MNFEIYCDESLQDLFTTKNRKGRKFFLIGSLWIEKEIRRTIKEDILSLRQKHNVWGEIKWVKASKSKKDFYFQLVDLFFKYGMQMRFRCIAVEAEKINLNICNNDKELGFYRFYYHLLNHWILSFNQYEIFCNQKKDKNLKILQNLHQFLQNTNLNSTIKNIQNLNSKEVVLIQLSDFLLGMASSRLNFESQKSKTKESIIQYLEEKLNIQRIDKTSKNSQKFNIFQIDLSGGW